MRLKKIKAWLLGVREFRLSSTTHFDDYDLLCSYDAGREFAHRATLRHWDESH